MDAILGNSRYSLVNAEDCRLRGVCEPAGGGLEVFSWRAFILRICLTGHNKVSRVGNRYMIIIVKYQIANGP